MIFAEALTTSTNTAPSPPPSACTPVLANITEFGKTPLFTVDELRDAGVRLALYPLGAFRAMSRAAEQVYGAIRHAGHPSRRHRSDANPRRNSTTCSDYHAYEKKLDALFAQNKKHDP